MKAILFDLDDTLFDHKHSRRMGLKALRRAYPPLLRASIGELEREHQKILDSTYQAVLDGKMTPQEGVTQRVALLCNHYGVVLSKAECEEAARIYDEEYNHNRRAVPGGVELIRSFAGRMKIGLVTNGMVEVQMDKLRICGLDGLFNCIIISEAVKHRKPDVKIFEAALKALMVSPEDAIFVGDSWANDIVPAASLGMRAVWLNRYGAACIDPSIAMEIHSLSDEKLAIILE